MAQIVVFGIGGYCEHCDETHDHPLHNLINIIEIPDEQAQSENTPA